MPLVATPAIILSSMRYSESSKIVRLATRDYGVQSGIAKGALRPKSRFGAALQVLSDGQAHLLLAERRDLHTLTAFDLTHLRVGLAENLDRYSSASALAEVVLRFAPAAPHQESYDLLRDSLSLLEVAPAVTLDSLGLRVLWRMVSVLGYAPALDQCVRDGAPLNGTGEVAFSPQEGGVLCSACARSVAVTRLPPGDHADLQGLVDADLELPALDPRHATAHRRLLGRYIQYHLGEGAVLPALEFFCDRRWATP